MPTTKRKLEILAAFSALLLLALMVGCTGFFVNPTVSSLAIGPQEVTITSNPVQTVQMSATGTYTDGSTKDLTGKVSWTSSDITCATISGSGLVTPAKNVSGVCTTTISASFSTVSPATTTITVSEGTPTNITLSANPTNPMVNGTVIFTAKATFPNNNTSQDITDSVTWTISNPTDLTLTNGSNTGIISATATVGEQITVTASFNGVNSNTVTLTIQ